MASTCLRSLNRSSLSSLRSLISKPNLIARRPPPTISFSSESARLRSISRLPVELGSCAGSMYPLHSAVAAARMTSRLSFKSCSCRDISQGTLCRTSPGL